MAAGRTVHICAAARDGRVVSALADHLPGVRVTHEGTITPGASIESARRELLDAADLIVLLVSADFASSPDHEAEALRALERENANAARVVPILSRAFAWDSLPYAHLLAPPRNKKPIVVEQRLREDAGPGAPPSVVEQVLCESTLAEVAREVRTTFEGQGRSDKTCPFPGLAFFDEDRAADFFGREAEVGEALTKLAKAPAPLRWLQIEGPSGAGKSSFARAGIVPAVREGKLAGGPKAWVTIVMRPRHDPVASLAEVLVKHAKPPLAIPRSLDEVTRELSSSPTALKSLLRESVPEGGGALLLVDQLEETFTLAHADPGRVKQFDALLAAALDDRDGPLVLVTTIRSDFVARMGELPELEGKLPDAARHYLREMKEGLRAAIEKPAERAGLSYEAGLVNRIVADACISRGALPLVAHVLEALYARREGRALTVRAYEQLGGVGGALAKSADAIVDGLGDEGRERARRLLLRLVKSGRGSEDTPQTASREAALSAAGGGPEAERVLARLSGGCRGARWQGRDGPSGRLVVVSGEEQSKRVDLVHEALIQRWATLRGWLKDERDALELRDDVEELARIWESRGRDEGGLPKGVALARLQGVERAALHEGARRFLEAAEEAEQRAEQKRRAREEATRRAAEQRQRRVIAGLLALVLGLLIITSRAVSLARELEASKRAQISQANMNMAAMVAGTVLSQLRALGDAVEHVAYEGEIAQALQTKNWTRLEELCRSAYMRYEDLLNEGSTPFNMWFALDMNGVIRAQYGRSGGVNVGKDYSWRDYFIGAMKVAARGRRSIHVSKAFTSENDGFCKFAISAPVYGSDNQPIGVLVAGVASTANLGTLDLDRLDNTDSIAVLVAPSDRDRADHKLKTPFLILRHPAFTYGNDIGMDSEEVRRVSEADVVREEHADRLLWPDASRRTISSDSHVDPAAATHPEYKGRWLAGFAPVGKTGFVVIVQTPDTKLTPEMNLFWQLGKWAGLSVVPGTLILLLMIWHERRRPSARAPS